MLVRAQGRKAVVRLDGRHRKIFRLTLPRTLGIFFLETIHFKTPFFYAIVRFWKMLRTLVPNNTTMAPYCAFDRCRVGNSLRRRRSLLKRDKLRHGSLCRSDALSCDRLQATAASAAHFWHRESHRNCRGVGSLYQLAKAICQVRQISASRARPPS